MEPVTDFSFKCRFVKDQTAMGLKALKATASQTELVVGDDRIPYSAIAIARQRENRVVFALTADIPLSKKAQKAVGDKRLLVLEVRGNQGHALAWHVNRVVSVMRAEHHRQELLREGKGGLFATSTCPHCGATIDHSGVDVTPYIFCVYCRSILTRQLTVVSDGTVYQECPSCGLYGRIRKYTSFYFYFLLVVYGYSYQQLHLCDSCAVKRAKRNLLVNLLFVLGVPFAIVMWIRALSKQDTFLKNLDRANRFAAKGNYARSDEIYATLLQEQPEHPGVLMNQALGHFIANDSAGGAAIFERVLRACSNYEPALLWLERVRQVQQTQGK